MDTIRPVFGGSQTHDHDFVSVFLGIVSVALRGSPFGRAAKDCSQRRPFDVGFADRNGGRISAPGSRKMVLSLPYDMPADVEHVLSDAAP